jgi:ubiquitin-like-conjugating enzyme ATG3
MVERFTNFIGDQYRGVAKGLMGVLKESRFYQEGVLTPEEFISAGDYLTQKCPTWKWCKSSQGIKPVDYLPEDKQYLVTLNVPCPQRAREHEKASQTQEIITDDGWVETKFDTFHRTGNKSNYNIIDIDTDSQKNNKQLVIDNSKQKLVVNDNYMDIDVVEEKIENKADNNDIEILEGENEDFIVIEQDVENVIRTRTYDISVTYDYYYRVPRMWLTGYNEDGIPLSDKEVKEDIMLEYVDKTVTIEKHPHTGINSVSIHPCRHSTLLLKMIENYEMVGKKLEVSKSIILFLKFLHSIVPTIQYDFTMDIDF